MSGAQLAQTTMFLASDVHADPARRVDSLLRTCSGFAYRIDWPAKTGEGGGIGTVAPEPDAKGHSVVDAFALEWLVQLTVWGHTRL